MTTSPRYLAAWALLAYAGVFLVFEFFELILPGGSFSDRARGGDFRSLFIAAMPILAVLLAYWVSPALRGARLIATIALVEYAIALFFGLLTWLVGLAPEFTGIHDAHAGLGALRYLVQGALELALITIAGYAVLSVLLGRRTPADFERR